MNAHWRDFVAFLTVGMYISVFGIGPVCVKYKSYFTGAEINCIGFLLIVNTATLIIICSFYSSIFI